MYIWILLATIMVALSFFNLSPRSDKEGYITEGKASAVVTRFRIEHVAAMRATECDLINKRSPTDMYNVINVDMQDENVRAFLPVGYRSLDNFMPKHNIYCLADRIEMSPELSTSCALSANRYLISYAKIPDRWITKSGDRVSPLPALTNYLAKNKVAGGIFGWTICDAENGCTLHLSQTEWDNNEDAADDQFGIVLRGEGERQGFVNVLMEDGGAFADECFGSACLISYNRYYVKNTGNHCAQMQQQN